MYPFLKENSLSLLVFQAQENLPWLSILYLQKDKEGISKVYLHMLDSFLENYKNQMSIKLLVYPPAIAIEQKVNTQNPRSTVGTSTEIYDYLKLLFARIGKTISPISEKEVKKHQVSDVVDYVCQQELDDKILVLFKLNLSNSSIEDSLKKLGLKGFSRIKVDSEIIRLNSIEDYSEIDMSKTIYVVIDRLVVNLDKDNLNRLADSIQIAFFEGNGECAIEVSW